MKGSAWVAQLLQIFYEGRACDTKKPAGIDNQEEERKKEVGQVSWVRSSSQEGRRVGGALTGYSTVGTTFNWGQYLRSKPARRIQLIDRLFSCSPWSSIRDPCICHGIYPEGGGNCPV